VTELASDNVASLAEHVARRHKAHRWTRWRDAAVKRHPELRSRALLVLDELVRRADNDTGHWTHYLARLGDATHLSERSVQRALGDLAGAGLIRVESERGRRSIEVWLLPGTDEPATPEKRQSDVRIDTEKRHADVTVSSPSSYLTAGTSQTTDPPQPPTGGRQRDLDRWREEVDHWMATEGIEPELAGYVRMGIKRDPARAAVLSYVEMGRRRRSWALGADDETTSIESSNGQEQLELGGDE
jgi:hypothetical protein